MSKYSLNRGLVLKVCRCELKFWFNCVCMKDDLPWIRAIITKQGRCDEMTSKEWTDIGWGHWAAEEWSDLDTQAEIHAEDQRHF